MLDRSGKIFSQGKTVEDKVLGAWGKKCAILRGRLRTKKKRMREDLHWCARIFST